MQVYFDATVLTHSNQIMHAHYCEQMQQSDMIYRTCVCIYLITHYCEQVQQQSEMCYDWLFLQSVTLSLSSVIQWSSSGTRKETYKDTERCVLVLEHTIKYYFPWNQTKGLTPWPVYNADSIHKY